jgi:hypothetical protein
MARPSAPSSPVVSGVTLAAARLVATAAMRRLHTMTTTAAFTTRPSSTPAWNPTIVAASVAAACDTERPKTTPVSAPL